MKLVRFDQTDKGAVLSFAEARPEEVASAMASFLETSGLNREEGTDTRGVWGSGSKTGRALGGAFAKRKKFDVNIEGSEPVIATITSAMSGWSGGAIGAMKEKKQRKEFALELQNHFQSRHGN